MSCRFKQKLTKHEVLVSKRLPEKLIAAEENPLTELTCTRAICIRPQPIDEMQLMLVSDVNETAEQLDIPIKTACRDVAKAKFFPKSVKAL